MSYNAPECPHCHRPTRFLETTQYGPPQAFTIVWRCDACVGELWEITSLCVAAPRPGECLSCAKKLGRKGWCRRCGLQRTTLNAQIHARCGSPPDPQAIRELCDQGLFRLALCAVNLRLASDRKDVVALQAKAKIYLDLARNDLAIPLLTRALSVGGDDDLLIDLGVALATSGRIDDAEASYRRYLEAHPTGDGAAVVLTNLGGLASARGQVDEGEALHRQAVAMDPENASARWNLMANLLRKRRYDQALEVIDEAIAAAPEAIAAKFRATALCYRTEVLIQLRRFAEALEDVDESLTAEPDSVDRMLLRARVLIGLDRLTEAERQLLTMLELVPDSPIARHMLARVREGREQVVH